MKRINISNNMSAIVDDDMHEYLSQWKWYARKGKYTWYASRKVMKKLPSGKWVHEKVVHMHRVVNDTPKGMMTDHINGDGLDNRRENLEAVNNSQNMLKARVRSDSSTGHKGVAWHSQRKKWRAYVWKDGKQKSLGLYKTIEEAVKARELALTP